MKTGKIKQRIALFLTLALLFVETAPAFAAGGQSVSLDVEVTEDSAGEESLQKAQSMPTSIQPSNWMSFLDDNAVITELNLPGSVNSLADGYGNATDKEQNVSIDVQLKERGVRVLEMIGVKEKFTVKYNGSFWPVGADGKITFLHKNLTTQYPYTKDSKGEVVRPCHQAEDDLVVDGNNGVGGINRFLKENPTEFVVIVYRTHSGYFTNGNNNSDAVINRWKSLSNVVVCDVNQPVPRVKDVRGKIVLIPQDVYSYIAGSVSIFPSEQYKFLTEKYASYKEACDFSKAIDSVLTDLKDQDLTTGRYFPSKANKFDGAGLIIDYRGENVISNNGLYSTFGINTVTRANEYLREKLASVGMYKKIGWILTEFSDWETSKSIIKTNDISKADCVWWGVSSDTLYLSGNYSQDTPSCDVIAGIGGENIPWEEYKDSITKVSIKEELKPVTMENWFAGFSKLTTLENFSKINTGAVTSVKGMFRGCESLVSFPKLEWNLPDLESTEELFYECKNLSAADVSSWNAGQVTSTDNMFYGCASLTKADFSNWSFENLTSAKSMFEGCKKLESGKCIFTKALNTSSLTDVSRMFYACSALKNTDMLSNWDFSGVLSVSGMFGQCSALADLSGFIKQFPSECTDMSGLFEGCSSLVNVDMSDLDVSKVKTFNKIFDHCTKLKTLDITGWKFATDLNTGGLTGMFAYDTALTTIKADPDFSFRNAHLKNTNEDTFGNNTSLKNGLGISYSTQPADKRNKSYYLSTSGPNGMVGYITPVNVCSGLTAKDEVVSYDGKYHMIIASCSKGGTVYLFDANGTEITGPGYKDPGTYVIWCGDYHGDVLEAYKKVTLTINKTSINNGEFKLTVTDKDDTGKMQEGNLFITDGKNPVEYGVKVTLSQNGVEIPEEEYTLTGTTESSKEGLYQLVVTGKGGYEGKLTANWGILYQSSHVTEHEFNVIYDGTDHTAYVETDIETATITYDTGSGYSSEAPKYKAAGVYQVDYKIEWSLSGSAPESVPAKSVLENAPETSTSETETSETETTVTEPESSSESEPESVTKSQQETTTEAEVQTEPSETTSSEAETETETESTLETESTPETESLGEKELQTEEQKSEGNGDSESKIEKNEEENLVGSNLMEGQLICAIWQRPVTAASAKVFALPGIAFNVPEVVLTGVVSADASTYNNEAGLSINGSGKLSSSTYTLNNAGEYRPVLVSKIKDDGNYILTEEVGLITVYDIEKSLGGAHYFEVGENVVLSVRGTSLAESKALEKLTFQWQKYNGSAWENMTGETAYELVIPMTKELHTSQVRCLVKLKDCEGTFETDAATILDINAIQADCLDFIGDSTATYDEANHTRSVSIKSEKTWLSDAVIEYSKDGKSGYSTSKIAFKNAGSYTIYYRVKKDGYNPFYGSLNLEIEKANSDSEWKLTFGEGKKQKAYTYNGNWHPAADGSEFAYEMGGKIDASNSKIYYGTKVGEYIYDEIPSQKDASWDYENDSLGSYTIYYRVVSNNYTDVTGELSFSIASTRLTTDDVRLSPGTVFAYDGKEHSVFVDTGLALSSYRVLNSADLSATEKGQYKVIVRGMNDYMGDVALTWEIKEGTLIPFTFDDEPDHDGMLSVVYDKANPKEYSVTASLEDVPATVKQQCKIEYIAVGWDTQIGDYKFATSSNAGRYKDPGTHYELVHVTPTEEAISKGTEYTESYYLSIIRILDVQATDVHVSYDGKPHSISLDIVGNWEIGGDELKIQYSVDNTTWSEENPEFIHAGNHKVYYRVLDEQGSLLKTDFASVIIDSVPLTAGMLTIAGINEFKYDGKPHTVELLLNGEPVDWSEFKLSADSDALTQTGSSSYIAKIEGTNDYSGTASVSWRIANNTADIQVQDYYGYYDGAAHSATLTVPEGYQARYYTSPDYQTGESTKPISFDDAGTHVTYFKVTPLVGEGEVLGTMTVSLAAYVSLPYEETYDGFEHTITLYLSDELSDATIVYSLDKEGEFTRTAPSFSIGTHRVYYRIVSEKYGIEADSELISISKATILATDFCLSPQEMYGYDGAEHEVQTLYRGMPLPKDEFSVSGTLKAKSVGEYEVSIQCSSGNYEIVDGAGGHLSKVTKKWKIVAGELPQVKVSNVDVVYDGQWHSAKAELVGQSAGLELKYYCFDEMTGEKSFSTSTMWNSGTEFDEPFAYQTPGAYFSYYEVSREGEVLLTGVMYVLIREAELHVKPVDMYKLRGAADPEFSYEIEEEAYKGTLLKDLTYQRSSGETPGTYKLSASVEDIYSNWMYKLNFSDGSLKILDVNWKKLSSQRARVGSDVTFEITGDSEDLSKCQFIWQIKKPGSTQWTNIDASNRTHKITLSKVTKDMDGSLIRCRIAVTDCPAADLDTGEVKLSVYERSDDYDEEETAYYPEGWGKRADGTWYLIRGGLVVKNSWEYVDAGNGTIGWFRFDKNGKMITGWYLDEKGDWYYMNPVSDGTKGLMLTGLITASNGMQYYLNTVSDGTKGKMLTGWIKIGNLWYYFDEDKNAKTYGALLRTARRPQ